MSLGKKVKQLRIKKGMNQKELAEASEITQATISRIESEQVKELKSEALKRLAMALGTSMDFLGGKIDNPAPDDIVRLDPTAKHIFRGYEKMSASEREQLKDFVNFMRTSTRV